MHQSELEKRYCQLKKLSRLGLTKEELMTLAKQKSIDFRIGSPQFLAFWQCVYAQKEPKWLLEFVMTLADMPIELSGEISETQRLLKHFSPDLGADHLFWSQLADLVDRAFPERTLGADGQLERRLHQFRYLISSQQVQYIRRHFKDAGESDRKALIRYLKTKKGPFFWRKSRDYTLMDSARLHNKLKYEDGKVIFPDNKISYNLKILMNFHTEFILDSQGSFLNEVDAEIITENGVVNGASFNYGTDGKRHWDLDVDPIRKHDPIFRNRISKGYRSPKWLMKKWLNKESDDFQNSYFNRRGMYSYKGRSSYANVKRQSRRLKWGIRLAKCLPFMK